MNIKCDYCSCKAELVFGDKIYPNRHDLHKLKFYLCEPCGAWVGTHKGNNKPLGSIANAELMKARKAAHAVFNPIWKSGAMTRTGARKWLANELGLTISTCNIEKFNDELCRKTVNAVNLMQIIRGEE